MEIVLARHAQPDWEPDGRAVDDPGLTALGHEQAKLAAEALASQRFDALYTSPLRRARETAEPIADALGMALEERSWLRELGLPSMQGYSAEQVQTFFRAANARPFDHWWEGLPGGENFRDFYQRVSDGVERLLQDDHQLAVRLSGAQRVWELPRNRERILIVAHEGTNAVLLSHLLGLEPVPFAWVRFSHAWAGISVAQALELPGGSLFALESFNRTDHLACLRSREDWTRDGRPQA